MNYNANSSKAEEFINHQEILDTLAYAQEQKNNLPLIQEILEKAKLKKGLNHREASILLASDNQEVNQSIKEIANEIKQALYGNRIVMFAPLYLSNYCINGCTYCPYHSKNENIDRKKLSQEEIRQEVMALQDFGHKRLVIESGEHPTLNSMDYILESIQTIYSIKNKHGEIRRVNVNIAATTVENYRKLHEANIGTYILFQETYHKEEYEKLHPTGPKSDYAYHTEAMDRAMDGGVDDVGLGVLFGLNLYKYDFAGLLMHAEHLELAKGVGPHTISVPRICPADGVEVSEFSNALDDDMFEKIVALIRLAVPYTGIIVSTRESAAMRERVLKVGVSQISGGSKTTVGGYAETENNQPNHSAQFELSDERTLGEVVEWLLENAYIPSFCTACYREGRTGDRFMQLIKSGQIMNCCQPNALITLQEYLMDYGSSRAKELGLSLLESELERITNPKARTLTEEYIKEMKHGKRDFRF